MAEKLKNYSIKVHDNVESSVIMMNVEWAAQQTWGVEIRADHHKIRVAYTYTHVHDATSITAILKILAAADETRDLRKAKVPGELANMISR